MMPDGELTQRSRSAAGVSVENHPFDNLPSRGTAAAKLLYFFISPWTSYDMIDFSPKLSNLLILPEFASPTMSPLGLIM